MTPVLHVVGGDAAGERIELTADTLELGRSCPAPGDLRDDDALSRRHARISRSDDGRVVISDLGSANGTFVNGHRIRARRFLSDGDTIEVGATTLQFEAAPDRATLTRDQPTTRRQRIDFRGPVSADRGGVVAGLVQGGVHVRTQVGDSISGATGIARGLIGVGLVAFMVGFGLFAYPIVMAISEGFSGKLGPGEEPSVSFVPFLPVGFGLAAVGAALMQFGLFLKR